MLVTIPFVLVLLDYWPLDRSGGAGPGCRRPAAAPWFGRLPVGLAVDGGKNPAAALAAACCAIVLSTNSPQSGNSVDTLAAGDAPGQRRGGRMQLTWASLFSRSIWHPLSSSGTQLPVAYGGRSTGSAGGDHRGRRLSLAPPAIPVGGLALVFGNAGAGQRPGAEFYARQGRPLHLSESDRVVDRGGLERFGGLPVVAPLQKRELGQADSDRRRRSGTAGAGCGRLASNSRYWHDSETLWLHALASTEHNAKARYNLAVLYARENRHDEAIAQLRSALDASSIHPALRGEIMACWPPKWPSMERSTKPSRPRRGGAHLSGRWRCAMPAWPRC